jgi:hypothetical protein
MPSPHLLGYGPIHLVDSLGFSAPFQAAGNVFEARFGEAVQRAQQHPVGCLFY